MVIDTCSTVRTTASSGSIPTLAQTTSGTKNYFCSPSRYELTSSGTQL